jgi:hypothetical protein
MFCGGRFRPGRGPVRLHAGCYFQDVNGAGCALSPLFGFVGALIFLPALVYPVDCVLDCFACAGYWRAGGFVACCGVGAVAGCLGRAAVLHTRLNRSGGVVAV